MIKIPKYGTEQYLKYLLFFSLISSEYNSTDGNYKKDLAFQTTSPDDKLHTLHSYQMH